MGTETHHPELPSVYNERCPDCHTFVPDDATICRQCGKTFDLRKSDRRCKKCFYVIENLPANRCPECGTEFDLNKPATFTTKPKFLFWTYWFPGLKAAVLVGLCVYVVLLPALGMPCATSVIFPVLPGVVLGYGTRIARTCEIAIWLILIVAAVAGLASLHVFGAVSAAAMGMVLFFPFMLGILAGYQLRLRMKDPRRNFSQRDHLPILLALLIHLAGSI